MNANSQVATTPDGHMMAMRLLRQVFLETGMAQQDVVKLTYNTCRRFLPTVANVLQLSRHDCQAIGNWVEDEISDKDGTHSRS